MTARELYNYALIEINKNEAPSLLLEDYNYLLNKGIQQKINTIYNRAEINQQSDDDISVLRKEVIINNSSDSITDIVKRLNIKLPLDYLHALNCIVSFKQLNDSKNKCGNVINKSPIVGCKKLTSDQFPHIITNYYMKPSYKNPYFFTNGDNIEILYGKHDNYEVDIINFTYIRKPNEVKLTEEMIDTIEDTSQILEFPDYINYEIVNEFVKLLLEGSSDPRLQTHLPINQTIMTGSVQQ